MTYVRSGGSDANTPLNTDPSLVPAQPSMKTLISPPPATGAPSNYNDWDYSSLPDYNAQPVSAQAPTAQPAGQPLGGFGNILAALGALFRGLGTHNTGMSSMIQRQPPRGQGAPGTNSLGNPFNRF